MDGRDTARLTVDWPQLKLLACVALPFVAASCVPAHASRNRLSSMDEQRGAAEAGSQPAEPREVEARERVAKRVAELLTPVSGEPAAPFDYESRSPEDRARALDCLATAIYYEARSEPEEGQRAVAQVVLNRVRHPAYPSTVCGVVFQGSHRRTGCQFSFTCDGSMRAGRRQPIAWLRARRYAADALAGHVFAPVGNATHYHTTAILPYWAKHLRKSAIVGAHIFYRWAGSAGEASAFHQRYGGLEVIPALDRHIGTPRVAVHRGGEAPRFRRETVSLRDGAVTIHRGPSALPRGIPAAAIDEEAERSGDAPSPLLRAADEGKAFGVRVHRGEPGPA